MQRFTLTFILMLLAAYTATAQSVSFQKTYNTTGPSNLGTKVIEQSDGSYLVSGIRSVPVGSSQYIGNILLFKIDSKGDTLWTKELGTSTDRELSYGMIQLPNNNLVIVGSINIPPNAATMDALIMCTDDAGNLLWQKKYGGNAQDYATAVKYDGTDLIVSGITQSYGAGNADGWLLKLNTSGDSIWTTTFGGPAVDDAWDIVTVNDGYMVTGGTYSYASGNYDDAWIVKLDKSGKHLWQKTYGIKDKVDWAWAMVEDKSSAGSGFVFVGVSNTTENQPDNIRGDLHFVKVDNNGNEVWNKTISGTPWRREGIDIAQLSNGDFVICGYRLEPSVQSQQLYIVKTDNSGNVTWDTAYGDADTSYIPHAITATSDGGWIITGALYKPANPIRYIFITKFDVSSVNVESIEEEIDIQLYPNPSYDNVMIKTSYDNPIYEIKLINLEGRVVQHRIYNSRGNVQQLQIDNSGTYIAEILTKEGAIRKQISVLD